MAGTLAAGKAARLTVVGTGIQSGRDLSPLAIHRIRTAEKVFVCVADPVTARWLFELNRNAESLASFYSPKKLRLQTYNEMTDRIMSFVERGADVCVVSYGHPGVCVYSTHKAIERARALGVEATMFPAVSCVDCLVADLGIDPAAAGLSVYDATYFLLHRHRFDCNSGLILLQIAVTGEPGIKPNTTSGRSALRALAAKLIAKYGKQHKVIVYEASPYPIAEPVVKRVALGNVASVSFAPTATLYVPPRGPAPTDKQMLRRFPSAALIKVNRSRRPHNRA